MMMNPQSHGLSSDASPQTDRRRGPGSGEPRSQPKKLPATSRQAGQDAADQAGDRSGASSKGAGMKTVISASVTERGQVTIPSEVRKLLGLKPHDKVVFSLVDGEVVLTRPAFTLESVYRSVPALKRPLDWDEMLEIAQEEVAEQVMRKPARE